MAAFPVALIHMASFCNTKRWAALPRKPRIKFITPGFSDQQAFTLIEVIVTIILVGILTSVALANLLQRRDRERLGTSSKAIAAWLDERRTQAMAAMEESGTGACVIDIDPKLATLTSKESLSTILASKLKVANICRTDGDLKLAAVSPGSSSIQLNSLDSKSQIVFTFRGTSPTDVELFLTIPNLKAKSCVKVLKPLGLIRIGKSAANSSDCDYTKPYRDFLKQPQ